MLTHQVSPINRNTDLSRKTGPNSMLGCTSSLPPPCIHHSLYSPSRDVHFCSHLHCQRPHRPPRSGFVSMSIKRNDESMVALVHTSFGFCAFYFFQIRSITLARISLSAFPLVLSEVSHQTVLFHGRNNFLSLSGQPQPLDRRMD